MLLHISVCMQGTHKMGFVADGIVQAKQKVIDDVKSREQFDKV